MTESELLTHLDTWAPGYYMLAFVWVVSICVITESWFDKLRAADNYDDWRWNAIGFTRIGMVFLPLVLAANYLGGIR